MHKLDVIILGSKSFFSTLNELKKYLNFNIYSEKNEIIINNEEQENKLLFCHEEYLEKKNNLNFIKKTKGIKLLASKTEKKNKEANLFHSVIKLPTTVEEINNFVESCIAKVKFSKNSSIKIKDYYLNKNEKKLFKDDKFIILTEKEIQLLELFLSHNKAISKNEILSRVWHYSSDADTHTVETHVYRLRKKINEKFLDNRFIKNDKDGYFL